MQRILHIFAPNLLKHTEFKSFPKN